VTPSAPTIFKVFDRLNHAS